MMDKDKLRKADLFSGGLIALAGLFIVSQALQMPMKDSWGGVQNVWYVSPAIFPLFVGASITVLGLLLMRTAVKTVGWGVPAEVWRFLRGPGFLEFLKKNANIRFYAILCLFLSFVFLMIPRIDFFAAAMFFLLAFISMFYPDDPGVLKKLLYFYLWQMALLVACLVFGIFDALSNRLPYSGDILVLAFIPAFALYAWGVVKHDPVMAKKFRTGLILALAAPMLIGTAFKYLLLVPMPFEGLVVLVLDAVWYFEF